MLRDMYDGIGEDGEIMFQDTDNVKLRGSKDKISEKELKKAAPVLTTAAINAMYQRQESDIFLLPTFEEQDATQNNNSLILDTSPNTGAFKAHSRLSMNRNGGSLKNINFGSQHADIKQISGEQKVGQVFNDDESETDSDESGEDDEEEKIAPTANPNLKKYGSLQDLEQ